MDSKMLAISLLLAAPDHTSSCLCLPSPQHGWALWSCPALTKSPQELLWPPHCTGLYLSAGLGRYLTITSKLSTGWTGEWTNTNTPWSQKCVLFFWESPDCKSSGVPKPLQVRCSHRTLWWAEDLHCIKSHGFYPWAFGSPAWSLWSLYTCRMTTALLFIGIILSSHIKAHHKTKIWCMMWLFLNM